ncbi:hypothetical protein CRM22_001176, partial [Opisthorchis felineus]
SKDRFYLNLEDEVIRGSLVLHEGKLIWPPPAPPTPPAPVQSVSPKPATAVPVPEAATPASLFQSKLRSAVSTAVGLSGLVGLGLASPSPAFTTMLTTFGLAGIVASMPSLFTPLVPSGLRTPLLNDYSNVLSLQQILFPGNHRRLKPS